MHLAFVPLTFLPLLASSFEIPGGSSPDAGRIELVGEAAILFSSSNGGLGASGANPFGVSFGKRSSRSVRMEVEKRKADAEIMERGDPLVTYCRFTNFLGGLVTDHVTPGRCTQIPYSAFSLGVESLETSASINCNFYRLVFLSSLIFCRNY